LVVNVDGEPDELELLREVLVDVVRHQLVEDDEFELEVVGPTVGTGNARYPQWPACLGLTRRAGPRTDPEGIVTEL
jgi:hypothetical protein